MENGKVNSFSPWYLRSQGSNPGSHTCQVNTLTPQPHPHPPIWCRRIPQLHPMNQALLWEGHADRTLYTKTKDFFFFFLQNLSLRHYCLKQLTVQLEPLGPRGVSCAASSGVVAPVLKKKFARYVLSRVHEYRIDAPHTLCPRCFPASLDMLVSFVLKK